MKIIKEGSIKINEPKSRFPLEVRCQVCGAELSIDEEDVDTDFGDFVCCPCCKSRIDLQQLSDVTFPRDFYQFGQSNDCVRIDDSTINKWIKKGVGYFKENPSDFCYVTGSGDVIIFVLNHSGDECYDVYVCRNYYVANASYTWDKDYKIQNACDWKWFNRGIRDD